MNNNTVKTTETKEERGAKALFSSVWYALSNIFKEIPETEEDRELKEILEATNLDEKSRKEILKTAKACNNATVSGTSNGKNQDEKYIKKIKVKEQQEPIEQQEQVEQRGQNNRGLNDEERERN